MSVPPRFNLPPELLAMVARYAARKPRPVQRAEYRRAVLAAAERRYRAIAPLSRDVHPQSPPAGVSRIDATGEGYRP